MAQSLTPQRSGPPEGFPLSADRQARVDAILRYWEHHTSRIKTYESKFTRETYDFVFGPKKKPRTVEKGTVRFAAPDKGLMRVEEVWAFDAEAKDPNKMFKKQNLKFGEYWVCDGKSIYQFDSRTKVLTETKLPPDMQGQSIGNGPLPFLFGAKADSMKQRYWIRELAPKNKSDGDYRLEAIPKRASDAANYDKIMVLLTRSDQQLMPKSMKVFNKQGYLMYYFSDHSPNSTSHRLADFFKSFVRPTKPQGWTKVVEDWEVVGSTPTASGQPRMGTKPPRRPATR